MKNAFLRWKFKLLTCLAFIACLCGVPASANDAHTAMALLVGNMRITVDNNHYEALADLRQKVEVGDIVFIQNSVYPFRQVAAATRSWTNHLGIVVDVSGDEPLVAESTFPVSRTTTLSRFVKKSKEGRVAIGRLNRALTEEERQKIVSASQKRMGIFYDTGFNLNSKGEFCSRFVREVLAESTGQALGEVETFSTLLLRNPEAKLGFWRFWFLGRIPWARQTVTPASLLYDMRVRLVFDGYAK